MAFPKQKYNIPLLGQNPINSLIDNRLFPAFNSTAPGVDGTNQYLNIAESMSESSKPNSFTSPSGGTEEQKTPADLSKYLGAAAGAIGLAADAYNTANNYTENTFEAGAVGVPTSQQGLANLSQMPSMPGRTEYDFGAQDFFANGGRLGHQYGNGGGWVDALGAAGSGAAAGAVFGPIGAAVGGAVGLGASLLGSSIRNANAREQAGLYNAERREQEANRMYALGLGASQIGHDRVGDFLRQGYADGGVLRSVMSGGNGVTEITKGGKHESNPLGGVPMGIASDGMPNLVEEGEVKWDKENYIFSNRLKPTKKIMKDNVLTNSKWEGKTYAEIAKDIQSDSEERENDPAARQTVDEMLGRLMAAQEETRMEKMMKEMQKMIAQMSPEELAGLAQSVAQQQPMTAQPPMIAPQPMQMPQGIEAAQQMPMDANIPQEEMMMQEQPMMAYGGHLFLDGGSTTNPPYGQTLRFNSKAAPLYTINKDGSISVIPNNTASLEYVTKRNYLLDNWDNNDDAYVQKFKENYIKTINEYNKGKKGFKPYSLDAKDGHVQFTKDMFEKGSADGQIGAIHNGIVGYAMPPAQMAQAAAATPATTTPAATATAAKPANARYYIRNGNTYEPIDDYNTWVMTHANYTSPVQFRTPTEGDVTYTDYFVEAPAEKSPMTPYPRYRAGLGLINAGIGLAGGFNPPDYEKANILDAFTPQPVDYQPIGGYLAYDPMDVNYMANMQRSQNAATRAMINNQVSPSRDAALLAADFNSMVGLGNAYEQARQYNDKDRTAVATFNRATDQANAAAANTAANTNFGLNNLLWDQTKEYAAARDAASTLASTANSSAVAGALGNLNEAYKDWYNTNALGWLVEQGIYPGVDLGKKKKV